MIFSEILGQNKTRMDKFRRDVSHFNVTCYVSETVALECREKIERTTDFLGNVLSNIVTTYLEGTPRQRDLTVVKPSNRDLHVLKEAFLTINQNVRHLDLITDPFQAVEEWIVTELEREITKPSGICLQDVILLLTTEILRGINDLQSDFERIVDLEADYVRRSLLQPDQPMINLLVANGLHRADATHISVVVSHVRSRLGEAVFVTFDYVSIIMKWKAILKVAGVVCCDPIYGVSHLR